MTKINDIVAFLEERYPLSLQLSFDNAGFLVGDRNVMAEKVMLALDVTSDVIEEAERAGAQLIISHHPVIWDAMKQMCPEDPQQKRIMELIRRNIAVLSLHTNLDIAENGVNDVLIGLLGASNDGPLDAENCGRVGKLESQKTMSEFLNLCKKRLQTNGLRYYDAGRSVEKIAVMGGSGGSAIMDAYLKGCDTYVTADLKYDHFLLAKEIGINLIDGDHFCTENPVIPYLCEVLTQRFNDVQFIVSEVHQQTAMFY